MSEKTLGTADIEDPTMQKEEYELFGPLGADIDWPKIELSERLPKMLKQLAAGCEEFT